jgi:3-oxoadipate enol-lactonase
MTLVPTILGPLYVDDQGSPDQPVALLWPSLFTDHTMWRAQVPALHAAGWRTLALDPPGHGRSPGPGRGFTMEECADAAVQVLDALGVNAPVVAFGTSWGGFVAPRIALRAPDQVRGMVLFNTSSDVPQLSQRTKATMLTKLMPIAALDGMVDRINLSTLLSAETRRDRPAIGVGIVRGYRSWDRRTLTRVVRSVLLDRAGIVDALPRITAPTLVVSGGQDTILPPRLGRQIVERLPQATYAEVADAAHLIPLEQPEAANRLIATFLQQLPI